MFNLPLILLVYTIYITTSGVLILLKTIELLFSE